MSIPHCGVLKHCPSPISTSTVLVNRKTFRRVQMCWLRVRPTRQERLKQGFEEGTHRVRNAGARQLQPGGPRGLATSRTRRGSTRRPRLLQVIRSIDTVASASAQYQWKMLKEGARAVPQQQSLSRSHTRNSGTWTQIWMFGVTLQHQKLQSREHQFGSDGAIMWLREIPRTA